MVRRSVALPVAPAPTAPIEQDCGVDLSLQGQGGAPGDLGRRVRERRLEVGIARDEVARRGGHPPGGIPQLEVLDRPTCIDLATRGAAVWSSPTRTAR